MVKRSLLLTAMVLSLTACSHKKPAVDTSGTGTTQTTSSGNSTDMSATNLNGPAPGSQQDLVVNVGDRVFFDTAENSLTSEAQHTLGLQAEWLKKYPNVHVQISGHCDERGTREYNLALGDRRASAAKDYLVSQGIDGSRITTISYGKERPAVTGSNASAWAQNRRAVTEVQ